MEDRLESPSRCRGRSTTYSDLRHRLGPNKGRSRRPSKRDNASPFHSHPTTTPSSSASHDARVSRARLESRATRRSEIVGPSHVSDLAERDYRRLTSGTLLYARWTPEPARVQRIALLSPDANGSRANPRESMSSLTAADGNCAVPNPPEVDGPYPRSEASHGSLPPTSGGSEHRS